MISIQMSVFEDLKSRKVYQTLTLKTAILVTLNGSWLPQLKCFFPIAQFANRFPGSMALGGVWGLSQSLSQNLSQNIFPNASVGVRWPHPPASRSVGSRIKSDFVIDATQP